MIMTVINSPLQEFRRIVGQIFYNIPTWLKYGITVKYQAAKVYLSLIFKDIFSFLSEADSVG